MNVGLRALHRSRVSGLDSSLKLACARSSGAHSWSFDSHQSRRGFASASDAATLKKLRSSGIILERWNPSPYRRMVLSPAWFREKRSNVGSSLKSSYAVAKIKKLNADFNPAEFPTTVAMETFGALNRALVSGNKAVARQLVVPELHKAMGIDSPGKQEKRNQQSKVTRVVNSGPVDSRPETNMRIIGFPKRPATVQIRMLQMNPQLPDLFFGQVSIVVVSDQVLNTSGKSQGTRAIQSSSGSKSDVKRGWEKLYTKDGKEYYHNHVTGKTQWKRPAMYGYEQVSDLFPKGGGTLGNGKVLSGPDEAGVYKVENVVVFEKPIHIPSQEWRIAYF